MRILYLSESVGWSGGAQQLLWMAGALRQKGHDLVVACQPQSELRQRAEAEGVPVELVRIRQDYDVIAAAQVAGLVSRRSFDVLHAQHPTAHAVGLIAAAFRPSCVFAVTRRVTFAARRNPFSRLKYLSGRIDGYVAVSDSVRAQLARAGVAESRVEVIPSVVRPAPASPGDRQRIRAEFRLIDSEPVIVTIANYASFKGQDYLLQAIPAVLQKCPKAQFLLAGRDTEKLAALAERLGIHHSIRLAGFRRDVPALLAASDVFVLPSLEEAAATALREAMLAGLPAVGTRVGGIPESIKDGETGILVAPADSQDLARGILQMIENPQRTRQMADQGRRWVESQFSLPAAAEHMESYYHRLISRRSGSPEGRQ